MLANRILSTAENPNEKKTMLNDVLLGVVTRMSENTRVETTSHPITAGDDDPMFPRFDEVILEQYLPLSMNEFTVAKGHEGLAWCSSRGGLASSKFFKSTRKLRNEVLPTATTDRRLANLS
jgi:hypothetical protein